MNTSYPLIIVLLFSLLIFSPVLAGQMSIGPEGSSLSYEQTYNSLPLSEVQNQTSSEEMEYVDGLPGSSNLTNKTLPFAGSYSSGTASTEFSGSSISGNGANQTPSAINTFSDKTMVSGFIKNFQKSFHYVSGISV